MSNVPFDVTPLSPRVDAPTGRTATVAFTVKNRVAGPTTGVISVQVEGPAAAWVVLQGTVERRFNIEGTEQVVVAVAPPVGTAAGEVSLRLRVARTDSVDVELAESPAVVVAVTAPPQKAPTSFPWWIIAVIVGVAIVGAVVAFVATRPPGFQDACTPADEDPCAAGLVCTDASRCLRESGQVCTGAADCADGACKEGLCALKGPPALGEKCPDGACASGLVCSTGLCRGPDGFAGCTVGDDCVDLNCRPGGTCALPTFQEKCTSQKRCGAQLSCKNDVCVGASGFVGCSGHDGCASGFCDKGGVCGEPGLLADCRAGGVACGGNLQCVSGRCRAPDDYAGCTEDAQCTSGFCSKRTSKCGQPGLGESCAVVGCVSSLRCDTDRVCRGPDGYRTCTTNSDCTNGRCRSGQCDSGALGEPCSDSTPCRSLYQCSEYKVVVARAGAAGVGRPSSSYDAVVMAAMLAARKPHVLDTRLCLLRPGQPCSSDFNCDSFNCSDTCGTGLGRSCTSHTGCSLSTERCSTFNRCINRTPPQVIQDNFNWGSIYRP